MKNLDKDEKLIYDELSQIKVDQGNINRNVIEAIRGKTRLNRKPFIASTVGIALSLFLVIGASAAVISNSEWFLSKFNPTYKEIMQPLDIKAEDKGIVVEAIAGKKYKNDAVVYLSIKDTTGKKRITNKTRLKNALYLGVTGKQGSYGIDERVINFDEETNTIYYEMNINTDKNTPLTNPLLIGTTRIYLDIKEYKDEKINLDLKDINNKEYFYLEESEIFGSNKSLIGKEKALKTGRYGSMIHNNDNQWISNLGIIDNKLHIQIASKFNTKFGPSDAFFVLKDKKENEINYDNKLTFITDKNGNIVKVDKISPKSSEYKYQEFIFPLNDYDLENYDLYYTGYIDDGIEGKWEIMTNLNGSSNNIKLIDKDFQVDEYLIQEINLNPLGLEINGIYNDDALKDELGVVLETTEGLVELSPNGSTLDNKESTFSLNYKSNKPILVDTVKSIIINEKKIDFHK